MIMVNELERWHWQGPALIGAYTDLWDFDGGEIRGHVRAGDALHQIESPTWRRKYFVFLNCIDIAIRQIRNVDNIRS